MALLALASSAPAALAATPSLAWVAHAIFTFGVLGVVMTVVMTRKPRRERPSRD